MSAYVLAHRHINAILSWANAAGVRVYGPSVPELDASNADDLQRMAEILHAENVRAVSLRYGGALPGDDGAEHIVFKFERPAPAPVGVLKLCACYDYQCEPLTIAGFDYAEGPAAAIIRTIRAHAIKALPGYSEAPWSLK